MGWDGMVGCVGEGEGLIFEVDFRGGKGSKAMVGREFGRGFLLR